MRIQLLVAAAFLLPVIYGQAQTPPPPPRNVTDILAVLDQYKPDAIAVIERISIANSQPPALAGDESNFSHRQQLGNYFHRRARANNDLGCITNGSQAVVGNDD